MFYFVNRVTLISSNCSDSEKSETQTKNIWALNLYFRDVNKKKRYEINLSINKGSGVKHTDNCKLVTNFMTFFSNFGERKHVNDRL